MNGVIDILRSIICGIISSLAIFPITSDAIRSMIFGRKKRALQSAKKELLETIEGMLLSGQLIGDITYGALVNNVARKYGIEDEILGTKDENIVVVLQTINSSKLVPNNIKRLVSDHIQAQIGDKTNGLEGHIDYEREFDDYDFNKFDFDETLKSKAEYEQYIKSPIINQMQGTIVFAVGVLTAVIVYVINLDNIFPIVICLSAILICINILTLLMDAAEFPTAETIKRLVYKVAFMIVLISLLLISAFIKVKT